MIVGRESPSRKVFNVFNILFFAVAIFLCIYPMWYILIQSFSSGNLDATLRELTGFGREKLSVIETNGRYECVWTAAGEDGNVVGRAVILDDGNYHYCMTVMADEEDALQLRSAWKTLFDSFILG